MSDGCTDAERMGNAGRNGGRLDYFRGNDHLRPKMVDELLTDPPCWHKVLFDTLVAAYDEVEAKGVDPVELIRKWKQVK